MQKRNHRWVDGQKTAKMRNVICERPLRITKFGFHSRLLVLKLASAYKIHMLSKSTGYKAAALTMSLKEVI